MAIAWKGAPIEVLETSRSHDNKLSACKNMVWFMSFKGKILQERQSLDPSLFQYQISLEFEHIPEQKVSCPDLGENTFQPYPLVEDL